MNFINIDSKTKTINIELEYGIRPLFDADEGVMKRPVDVPTSLSENNAIFLLDIDKVEDLSEYSLKFDFKTTENKKLFHWDSLP
ncbi:hypothetical protein [Ureaplasma diversum]|uniref:Uncharacterized protein n=1 Tax=Ureaplasma diversum NCTC 246 TaxID=1188241 RepID=A0A084F1N8_9BACT|nr:hypothetical protein [Ureaplasma diversum]KEZ24130.1 hypothetical protein UDIV_0160 [Ureaplasma diversum NCTC 246]